ncbi:MAG: CARDB domain-containing protein, partial [Candidatus Poseidoniaceae archaeon]
LWSDGSLTEDGEYLIEVPLDSAKTLQSSPTRTCLISITNIPGRGEDMTGTLVSTTLRVVVDDAAPRVVRRMAPLNVIDVSSTNDLSSIYVEFQGSEDADLTGSEQMIHWVMRDQTRTVTIGAGSALLGMQQVDQVVYWTGEVDITAGGTIDPQAGDFVGFYMTGWDAAGNQFPVVSNSEASPIPELAFDDTDFERQWVRLGAVGPELRMKSIEVSDDHVSPGSTVQITGTVVNNGGATESQFKVAFFAGDDTTPFDVKTIIGIGEGEVISITVDWEVEDVDRVRVEADYGNILVEVNDNDNTAEHDINIAYGEYLGWLDSPREQPLAWIFAISTILILVVVATVASRTAVDLGDGAFAEDDEDWEEDDDEYYDDEYDDDDD